MTEIPLTQGKVALVDDADFEWLSQWKWIAHDRHKHWYATRRARSGYKGVSFHKKSGRWRAKIRVNYKWIHLGSFDNPQQAATAYETAAREHGGEFARAR